MGRGLLILVAGLLIVNGIVFKSMMERQQQSGLPQRSGNSFREQQGKNMTASLMDVSIKEIQKNQSKNRAWNQGWGGSFAFSPFLGGDSASIKGFDQTMQSTPEFPQNTHVTKAGGWDEYRLLLYAKASFEGEMTYTEVLLQQDSFAKYSYFTHIEPSNIWFTSQDNLTGPVHTNGTFNIAGSPVFNGFVSSPNAWREHPWYTNNPQFNGGSNFTAPVKNLPDKNGSQTSKLSLEAQIRGMYFTNPITVEMLGNQFSPQIKVTEYLSGGGTAEHLYNKSQYDNGVISSTGLININGTLDGRLTVHSKADVEIMGDLKYKTDPTIDSTSTNLLGIVSENNVIVDKDAHTNSGTSDLTLQASIMTLSGKFYVENYSSGPPRGTISLLGGLIQYERGPVGTFSGGSVASGFSKNYIYDTRLLTDIPPFFPRESQFSIVYWRDRTAYDAK